MPLCQKPHALFILLPAARLAGPERRGKHRTERQSAGQQQVLRRTATRPTTTRDRSSNTIHNRSGLGLGWVTEVTVRLLSRSFGPPVEALCEQGVAANQSRFAEPRLLFCLVNGSEENCGKQFGSFGFFQSIRERLQHMHWR